MKKIIVGLLVCLLVVSQVQAMGWRDRGFDKDKMAERMCKELNLSDEQKDKFMSNNKQMQSEMKKHHEEVKKYMDIVRQELEKDSPNRGKIHQEITKVEAVNTKIHLKRIDSLLELKKMLTPEQRERFKKMGRKMRQHEKKADEKPCR
ncbi:MAG: periplasmic heavy metal sensor [bacterium]